MGSERLTTYSKATAKMEFCPESDNPTGTSNYGPLPAWKHGLGVNNRELGENAPVITGHLPGDFGDVTQAYLRMQNHQAVVFNAHY
jgi:hypothetical protein